jgi:hypothetical protein
LLVWAVLAGTAVVRADGAAAEVDFNRDVLPLLSEKCFACHGPDAKALQGGLRLDHAERATQPAKSGRIAVVPSHPEQSELIRRIQTTDASERMPPPDSHKTLTESQRDLLYRWIKEGAKYRGHWAYLAPKKVPVPPRLNPVDYLVEQRWKALRLRGAPAADPRTLVRRLHFDLVGLPPSSEVVAFFVAEPSAEAYRALVEQLLASPHFGERLAIGWLDLVRFADTIGYHSDNPRNIWPYRDYVIRAFNQNMPFDRFTREQLAGDLLPNPTVEQKVASGFNRLLLTTEEGGAQPQDYEARYLADRVRALGTVWLAQTIGCAQCHDHKFDPFTTRDFYSLGAFFADIKEAPIGRREDGLLLLNEEQAGERSRHEREVTRLQTRWAAPRPELQEAFVTWQKRCLSDASFAARAAGRSDPRVESSGDAQESEPSASATSKKTASAAAEIIKLLQVPESRRDPAHHEKLWRYFRDEAPEFAELRNQLAEATRARAAYEESLPRSLVAQALPKPRLVRILPRGDWMNATGELVEPALPAVLAGGRAPAAGARLSRLDLADWLVSPTNPLTPRVVMNRLWRQFFGAGIATALDDFGAQGEPPSDPVLLDWLACEFRDSGWDMKHMVRLLVTSETYRQSSVPSRSARERDPDNRAWTRQGRWRLEAELLRDNALALSGLLDVTIGGPSVKPYQPANYWENLNFPKRSYDPSAGAAQHRRGIYTWWQRTFPHPSLLAFDAPSREECTVDRPRSNIPQQALVLLNDPSHLEAASALAMRILRECGGDDATRIRWAWLHVLGRPPQRQDVSVLLDLLRKHRAEYRQDPAAAAAYLKAGAVVLPATAEASEWAAWTNVARALLNLHETITRS